MLVFDLSLEVILLDLIRAINFNKVKRHKLLRRLLYIICVIPIKYINTISIDTFIKAINCCVIYINHKNPQTKPVNINTLISKNTANYVKLYIKTGNILIYNLSNFNLNSNRIQIEQYLTSVFVKNNNTYNKSRNLFLDIINFVTNKLHNVDIFARFKGGMNAKYTLEKLGFKNINNYFSNSDNDTVININPDISDFDSVFNLVSDYVFEYLCNWQDKGIFNEEINNITTLSFKPIYTRAYTLDYKREYRFNTEFILFKVLHKKNFRITRNFVKIPMETNHIEMFELIRLKAGFEINNKIFYAELLDIAIPYKTAKSLHLDFLKKNKFLF